MKKSIIATIILALVFFCGTAFAQMQEYSISSGDKTADALIETGQGLLHGICVVPDGTNAITVSIYDNTTNSGKLVIPTFIVAATPSGGLWCAGISPPAIFNFGLYVDITCSGTAHYNVYTGRK